MHRKLPRWGISARQAEEHLLRPLSQWPVLRHFFGPRTARPQDEPETRELPLRGATRGTPGRVVDSRPTAVIPRVAGEDGPTRPITPRVILNPRHQAAYLQAQLDLLNLVVGLIRRRHTEPLEGPSGSWRLEATYTPRGWLDTLAIVLLSDDPAYTSALRAINIPGGDISHQRTEAGFDVAVWSRHDRL